MLHTAFLKHFHQENNSLNVRWNNPFLLLLLTVPLTKKLTMNQTIITKHRNVRLSNINCILGFCHFLLYLTVTGNVHMASLQLDKLFSFLVPYTNNYCWSLPLCCGFFQEEMNVLALVYVLLNFSSKLLVAATTVLIYLRHLQNSAKKKTFQWGFNLNWIWFHFELMLIRKHVFHCCSQPSGITERLFESQTTKSSTI